MNGIPLQVRAQFEALVMQPLLRPLEAAFGDYGELAGESFEALLAREFEA